MEERHGRVLRADAERNRQRLLAAATEMFSERGLEVGVAEIADRAGVGRGTLFRNFPTKEHLIAAIMVEGAEESLRRGRAALEADEPDAALFDVIDQYVSRSQTDRALFDALADTWMAHEDIRRVHAELLEVMEALLRRAQQAGAVRADVSAVDVLMMVKGVCESGRSFQNMPAQFAMRQVDLLRAALRPQPGDAPLRGRAPTLEDLEQSHDQACSEISSDAMSTVSAAPRSH